MNLKALELKEHIIESLGGRVVREIEISDEALSNFGLQTKKNHTVDWSSDASQDDSLAFTLITKDRVLPTELIEIVDSFARENKGSSRCANSMSPLLIIWIGHIEYLRHIMIRRIDRKLNIAILNT